MLYIIHRGNYELTNRLFSEIKTPVIYITTDELSIYKNKFVKIASIILSFLGISLNFNISKELKKELKKIKTEDSVLFWDFYTIPLILSAAKYCKCKKKSLWLWNTFPRRKTKLLSLKFLKKKLEIYTFDEQDALLFKINLKNQICYNIQKYKENIEYNKGVELNDLYFIGVDKGRYAKLVDLYDFFMMKKLSCDFTIIRDKLSVFIDDTRFSNQTLSFDENIKHIFSSKCLIELVKENQTGLTMRALEAFLADKKLVTNNKYIMKQPFYKKENIFVLGVDNSDQIVDFINSEYLKVDSIDKSDYLINNWILDFYEE